VTNHPVDDDDFGAMLEASLSQRRPRAIVGEKVKATVVSVGPERLTLDLGNGQDGLMELHQLGDAAGRPDVKEGDVVEAFVLRVENRVAELGFRADRGSSRMSLEDAHRSGLPVSGLVSEVNKGGFVVEIGSTRAFCPLGAMDARRIDDPSAFVGQRLQFRVVEMRGPRDVVVSRRVVLEEENARRAAEARERVKVGAHVHGVVTGVRDFGAFIDLGGIEGMVPAGEMGHGWTRPQDALAVGQEVDVEVLAMEEGADRRPRITLSMKALMADPFTATSQRIPPGTVVAGRITRVQPFGAFVELVPGVEGLIHVSAFGRRIGHPSEVVRPGQSVAVRVEGVDAAARRISLQLVEGEELEAQDASEAAEPAPAGLRILRHAGPAIPAVAAPASRPMLTAPPVAEPAAVRAGDVFDVTVDEAASFGVFVSWPTGRGLVPARESGLPRNADLRRQFPVGTKLRAAVVDIRPDGKLTLSLTAVERFEERAETEAYRQRSEPSRGSGLGTLGDMLKGKPRR
jgi:small subunit ribosomal protein S1